MSANDIADISAAINQLTDSTDATLAAKKTFWWLWRFLPEILAKNQSQALLFPVHRLIPCPLHSYNCTVSALAGAMFPAAWESGQPHQHPYLFLFTFSPVQEFIKASRKFLDFWAGSYLLHYLSAKLCWYIADEYDPDAVIMPSLWSQEIIDALIVKAYPGFVQSFQKYTHTDPVSRFNQKQFSTLSTAGFPNAIAALIPGKEAASALGKNLTKHLQDEWKAIAHKVRADIKQQVIEFLKDTDNTEAIATHPDPYPKASLLRDLEKWLQPGCWEWNSLWDAQIERTWETYWSGVPLGNPEQKLVITKDSSSFDPTWIAATEAIVPSRVQNSIPTEAEENAYNTLNVGTWWGNVQSRLGRSIQSVKNTRNWQIPSAPGERSTLSGQFSAVHPNLLYDEQFKEGGGLSSGSMRLFWRVMAEVYPGLFNGSEKLNAIELTKRMAWGYGEVAESLGIEAEMVSDIQEIDYEKLIRFPNLSSIASARFAHDNPTQVRTYWNNLNRLIRSDLPQHHDKFGSRTRSRPFHVAKTDAKLNPDKERGQDYNGVMFSSKWLAEDMGCTEEDVATLRSLVDKAHRDSGFGEGSPSDWWVIVLADGDGMGKYVSGTKLKEYECYTALQQFREGVIDYQHPRVLGTPSAQSWTEAIDRHCRIACVTGDESNDKPFALAVLHQLGRKDNYYEPNLCGDSQKKPSPVWIAQVGKFQVVTVFGVTTAANNPRCNYLQQLQQQAGSQSYSQILPFT